MRKITWRYFLTLFIPMLIILLLGVWLTSYAHSRGIRSMQESVEQSNQRATESIATGIDSLLNYGALNAINLSFQVDVMQNSRASRLSQYNSTVDQLIYMQLNSGSLLQTLVDRSYIFLFDENRVITQSSMVQRADDFYDHYFTLNGQDYDAFRTAFTKKRYVGEVLPQQTISYMGTNYSRWLMAQSIPLDSTATPRGVILFSLREYMIEERLKDGVADANSLCVLAHESGAYLASQGAENHWDSAMLDSLLSADEVKASGVSYLSLADGMEYLVTVSDSAAGRILSAQPVSTGFMEVQRYSSRVLLVSLTMMLLAMLIAALATRHNVGKMNHVMNSIAPEYQSENAPNVYAYMEEAFLHAKEKEAALEASDKQKLYKLQNVFLKRLLRGEWQTAAEIQQEQEQAGLNLDAKSYVVLMICLWQAQDAEKVLDALRETVGKEFGDRQSYLVRIADDQYACLLLGEETELNDSIEAVAEELNTQLHTSTMVSAPVTELSDVPQAYRQVRTMSRIVQEGEKNLYWYRELFQDDVLYNYEYSMYTETGLRNNIMAGNEQTVREMLVELYRRNLRSSVQSGHVIRFFACDLYRLVNHLGAGEAGEKGNDIEKLRSMLDSVLEDPKQFDYYFGAVMAYCLELCSRHGKSRGSAGNEIMKRITDYLDEHYTDQNLSIGSMADDLKMSGKYLSTLFKEQTGEKLSSYIERMRIEHASRLLEETDMSINDVALASGYALTHTFRVAFKRVQGVAPMDWKKTCQSKKTGGNDT